MTSIRKIAFVIFSVSAFIYLVLQTSYGQQWLNKTKHSLIAEPVTSEQLKMERMKAEHLLQNTFAKMMNDSQQAKQLQLLQSQLEETQKQFSELSALIRESAYLDQVEGRTIEKSDTSMIKQDQDSTKQQMATGFASTVSAVTPVSGDNGSLAAVPTEKASQSQSQTDVRQRLLAHQARLQEVVQRMELTALQAISR
ncbi:hypothetical protein [Glaciecola sp. MF2-115]|uniref:hypothetical protein n=1 Tax=Glaciecola sp. MF2-115 TaxID=3384827 RepID=UPI0039A3618F